MRKLSISKPILDKEAAAHLAKVREVDLELAAQIKEGCEIALQILQNRYLPKLVRWVIVYQNQGLELEEMIKIGEQTLEAVAQKFNNTINKSFEELLMPAVLRDVASELQSIRAKRINI